MYVILNIDGSYLFYCLTNVYSVNGPAKLSISLTMFAEKRIEEGAVQIKNYPMSAQNNASAQ
ncbi:hypothetical protein DMC15_14630 [Vibrio sp. 11986-1-5]|nr:hypothetical protein DMC15_14630 [Vibrio sp. 11986-1-5]